MSDVTMHDDLIGPWDGWQNAEIYQGFVSDFPIYRLLSRRLADHAHLQDAHRVLDVACGTGATSRACLRRMRHDAELVGVDQSEAMVTLARTHTSDPRSSFRVAPAARLHEALGDEPRFDRAVSSAALWQFSRPGRAVASLARLLAPGALFVFNVPVHRLADREGPVHALQVALARAVADAAAGKDSDAGGDGRLEISSIRRWLEDAGFADVEERHHSVRSRQDELLELMRIPAMAERMAPDLAEVERERAFERVSRRVDLGEEVEVPWIDFVARKEAIDP